jgi:hypothetical protein
MPLSRRAYLAYHLRPPGLQIAAAAHLAHGRRRLGGPPRTVLVGPEPVALPDMLWKVLRVLGLRAVRTPGAHVCAVHWDLATAPAPWPVPGAVNGGCLDISKSRVEAAARAAFGYGAAVEPTRHDGPMVRKSEENARHDGTVVRGPMTAPEPGAIYQRLVDTEAVPGVLEELRVVLVAGSCPVVYVKRRPSRDRFGHGPSDARAARPEAVMSAEELAGLRAACADMRLDLGEADLLRDRRDGRLYLVDVNKTPWGPPRTLGTRDALRAVRATAEAFDGAFLAPAVRERPVRVRTLTGLRSGSS